MQTGNREYFGRNQFWTPSNISITQSIIDDKLNNITLNDNNSSELFTVNGSGTAIQTKNNIPLAASQFIITGSNEEIDANENNAVNKRYLSTKINSLDDKYFLKSNIINKDQDPSIDTVYSSDSTKMLLNYKSDKTYVDENLDLKANIVDVNNGLAKKANINDVYNKTDIDDKLSDVAILDNVYTKQEIDSMEEGLVDCSVYSDTYSETSEHTTYLNNNRFSPLTSYFSLYTLPIDDTDSIPDFLCVLFKITGTIKFTGENVLSILGKNGDAGLSRLQLIDNDDNTYPLNFGIQRIFPLTDAANELILKIDTVLMTPLKTNKDLRIYYYYSSSDPDGTTYRFNYEINLEFKDYTFCRRSNE